MQRKDFAGLFEAMDGYPVIIRTLDPPLHEFLPKRENLMVDLALLPHAGSKEKKKMSESYGIPVGELKKKLPALLKRVEDLHEFNPMLGFRGCRLGIVHSDITEMQARAIFEAAVQVAKKGIKVIPEVMIPLVGFQRELAMQKEIVERVAKEVLEKAGMKNLKYMIGTMIEIPRGALTADQIAEVAQFFSFGTNDLTQTTLGMSRDDYTKFSKKYEELKIFKADPFQTIDQEGVGKLIEQAVKLGRKTNPKLEIGICGEHGGDPSSVEFCYRVGMDYVSCSPYRVPIARLAAAQAAIAGGDKTESYANGLVLIRRLLAWLVQRGRLPLRLAVVRVTRVPLGLLLFGFVLIGEQRVPLLLVLLFLGRQLTGAGVQVLFGQLLAVGRRVDRALQHELVARQILRSSNPRSSAVSQASRPPPSPLPSFQRRAAPCGPARHQPRYRWPR